MAIYESENFIINDYQNTYREMVQRELNYKKNRSTRNYQLQENAQQAFYEANRRYNELINSK